MLASGPQDNHHPFGHIGLVLVPEPSALCQGEYKLLQATSRGPTFEGRPKGDPPATPSRSVPTVPDVPAVPDVRDGAGEAAVPESGATGSTEPTASAAESSEVEKPRPSRTPGWTFMEV